MLDEFRALFGDERADYGAALQRHYEEGAPRLAGRLHQRLRHLAPLGGLRRNLRASPAYRGYAGDRACARLSIDARRVDDPALRTEVAFDAYRVRDFDAIVAAWTPVSIALNSLTRSLDNKTLSPFVLSQTIIAKLDFIHRLIRAPEATAPVAA